LDRVQIETLLRNRFIFDNSNSVAISRQAIGRGGESYPAEPVIISTRKIALKWSRLPQFI
jgi:hypothetical protein